LVWGDFTLKVVDERLGADAIAAVAIAAAPDIAGDSRAEALAIVQRGLFGDGGTPIAAPPGTSVGRYVVLEDIGQGGMGTVTRAYDPKLRREVALKRLVRQRLVRDGAARLLREAQVMAQLSHPNVVGVYDVETLGDEVVLVMELVAGDTLRAWLSGEPRTWREILAAFVHAGSGLAAAHRVGIVHRDFKATNVLVARDGTIKVTDFGLAKSVAGAGESAGESESADASSDSQVDALADPLTRADTAVGTPRYMAPEQHRGVTDARADQFAFCVALWEALCGRAPYLARTLDALHRAKHEGPPKWTGPRIPGRTNAALRRGLAPDPAARWPSMDALLAELAPRSRARVLGLAASVVVVGAAAISAAWAGAPARELPCSGAEQALQGTWDDDRRTQVQAAFSASAVPYAGDAAHAAVRALDEWSQTWATAHREACEATAVRGEQSAALMDLRMACLGRARRELDAIARTLSRADVEVVDNVDALLAGLPAIDRCADIESLQADMPFPADPAIATWVDDVRAGLAHARALRLAGHFEEARDVASAWTPAAEAIAYAPLHAEAALEQGLVLDALTHYGPAEARLEHAMQVALAAGAWSRAAEAGAHLAHVVGFSARRTDEGTTYAELAVSLAEGAGGESDVLALALTAAAQVAEARGDFEGAEDRARRALKLRRDRFGEDDPRVAGSETTLAQILEQRGHPAEAEALLAHALEVRRRAFGADHPQVAIVKNVMGSAKLRLGRYAEAEAFYAAAIAGWSATLGRDHLLVTHAESNLGLALHHQGRFSEAEARHRGALARREVLLGPDHPVTLDSRNNLGLTLHGMKRLDDARAVLEPTLTLREAKLGREHPSTIKTANNLGMVLLDSGDHVGAEAAFRRAARAWALALGDEHPWVAAAHHNLGLALHGQGRIADAEAEWRHAIATWDARMPADYPDTAHALHSLGVSLLDRGEAEEALAVLERAWTIRSAEGTDPALREESAAALARARAAR
jgi:tetratricopeptide (TPR) repeat protein/tRNA A-37 threonylcarbamoyl transferase component Bud32